MNRNTDLPETTPIDTRPVDVDILVKVLDGLRENVHSVDERLLALMDARMYALDTVVMVALRIIEQRLPMTGLMEQVIEKVQQMQVADPGAAQELGQYIETLRIFGRLRVATGSELGAATRG